MTIDDETMDALGRAITALNSGTLDAIPAPVLAPLIEIARPGRRIHLDVEASQKIGAPLIRFEDARTPDTFFDGLTRRQKEVSELIAEGLSNKQIADRLGITLATVKDHVHAALSKLGLPSRTALVSALHSQSKN